MSGSRGLGKASAKLQMNMCGSIKLGDALVPCSRNPKSIDFVSCAPNFLVLLLE